MYILPWRTIFYERAQANDLINCSFSLNWTFDIKKSRYLLYFSSLEVNDSLIDDFLELPTSKDSMLLVWLSALLLDAYP